MAAITPAYGYESYIQIAKEATYNSAAVATHKFAVYELDVTPNLATYQSRALVGGISKPSMLQGIKTYDVRILLGLSYDFMMRFAQAAMGVATFGTDAAPTGAGPYTYAFKDLTTLQSYTIQAIETNRDATGATGKCNTYTGCKLKTFKVHGEAVPDAGSVITVELVYTAAAVSINATPTAALVTAVDAPVYFYHATTVDDGTADAFIASGATNIIMKSFDLTIDLNLTPRFMIGLSTQFEPARTGFASVQFSCVKEVQTSVLFSAAVNLTSGSPKLLFDNGLSTTSNRQWIFDIGTAKIISYNNPVRSSGITEQNVTWDTLNTVGGSYDTGIIVTNISGQATMATAQA